MLFRSPTESPLGQIGEYRAVAGEDPAGQLNGRGLAPARDARAQPHLGRIHAAFFHASASLAARLGCTRFRQREVSLSAFGGCWGGSGLKLCGVTRAGFLDFAGFALQKVLRALLDFSDFLDS